MTTLTMGREPNRLRYEKSPYLLQHAFNPVDWYAWGEEAFTKAKAEDKPIFLSIGYSACYWCHVMEREVFEDDEIARLMNEKLVSVKVDREERPDIDRIYMAAVQMMTGSGGWPMSVFLTADLRPFFGGTYFPPRSQYNRPGFPDVVRRIDELWRGQREKILAMGDQLTSSLRAPDTAPTGPSPVSDTTSVAAFDRFKGSFDPRHAGFGGAPKFPRPAAINFLLRYHARSGEPAAREMGLSTLRAMADGGIHDHLGGGFHRYSVDDQWRIPHFEKMLYDQAQLAVAYLEAYQLSKEEAWRATATDILEYVLTSLTNERGGFSASEDAESAVEAGAPEKKEEGIFYLWTKGEIGQALGAPASKLFLSRFGVEEHGNAVHDPSGLLRGKNVLYAARSLEDSTRDTGLGPAAAADMLKRSKSKLLSIRSERPRPTLDDKIITAWNGLMISAFAKGHQILEEPRYLDASRAAASFILDHLLQPDGRKLLRRYRDGDSRFAGGLQDYAFLIQGLLDLYESSFEERWITAASSLAETMIEEFWDHTNGGFFDATGRDGSLLVRTKEEYDGAEPSGNSVAALVLLRLGALLHRPEWEKMAERTISAFGDQLRHAPDALAQLLVAIEWLLTGPLQVVLVGNRGAKDTAALLRVVRQRFLPNIAIILCEPGSTYFRHLGPLAMVDGHATAYICEGQSCRLPTADGSEVERMLASASTHLPTHS